MSCDLLNLIGTANIPAVPTKICRVTPDVFFLPLPPFRRARAELRIRKNTDGSRASLAPIGASGPSPFFECLVLTHAHN